MGWSPRRHALGAGRVCSMTAGRIRCRLWGGRQQAASAASYKYTAYGIALLPLDGKHRRPLRSGHFPREVCVFSDPACGAHSRILQAIASRARAKPSRLDRACTRSAHTRFPPPGGDSQAVDVMSTRGTRACSNPTKVSARREAARARCRAGGRSASSSKVRVRRFRLALRSRSPGRGDAPRRSWLDDVAVLPTQRLQPLARCHDVANEDLFVATAVCVRARRTGLSPRVSLVVTTPRIAPAHRARRIAVASPSAGDHLGVGRPDGGIGCDREGHDVAEVGMTRMRGSSGDTSPRQTVESRAGGERVASKGLRQGHLFS